MSEIWKDIKGYEGHYKVSNIGNVYSCKSKKILSPSKGHYYKVILRKDGKSTGKSVHRLVAEAFIPNPENKPQVNHIDHDTYNNTVTNLEWVTRNENLMAYFRSEKREQGYKKLLSKAEERKKKI